MRHATCPNLAMGLAHPYPWFAAHVDMGGFLRASGASMALGFGNRGVEIRIKVGFARSATMGPTVHIVLQGGGSGFGKSPMASNPLKTTKGIGANGRTRGLNECFERSSYMINVRIALYQKYSPIAQPEYVIKNCKGAYPKQ